MLENIWLCWVQALQVYLAKTEDKHKNKELFFISYTKMATKGDFHKNTLSGMIRKLSTMPTRQQTWWCCP